MTKDVTVRNYDVNQYTGYPMSTVGAGRWARGTLYRAGVPVLATNPHGLFSYDPTNPLTWNLSSQPQ